MSAKRFNSRGMMIVLLAIVLVGGGCATTSSQVATHKPQMITSDGVEEVGGFKLPPQWDNGFNLSDGWASFLNGVGQILWGCAGGPSLP